MLRPTCAGRLLVPTRQRRWVPPVGLLPEQRLPLGLRRWLPTSLHLPALVY